MFSHSPLLALIAILVACTVLALPEPEVPRRNGWETLPAGVTTWPLGSVPLSTTCGTSMKINRDFDTVRLMYTTATMPELTIKNAMWWAVNLTLEMKTKGRDKYPHKFKNKNNAIPNFNPKCNRNPEAGLFRYSEFPIDEMMGGWVYNGGPNAKWPSDHRVVFHLEKQQHKGWWAAIYCGTITHEGAPQGQFNWCNNDPPGWGRSAESSESGT